MTDRQKASGWLPFAPTYGPIRWFPLVVGGGNLPIIQTSKRAISRSLFSGRAIASGRCVSGRRGNRQFLVKASSVYCLRRLVAVRVNLPGGRFDPLLPARGAATRRLQEPS